MKELKSKLSIQQSFPETQVSLVVRPRSLTMGPSLILANAAGVPEAQAIVAEWHPANSRRIVLVSVIPEHVGWQ